MKHLRGLLVIVLLSLVGIAHAESDIKFTLVPDEAFLGKMVTAYAVQRSFSKQTYLGSMLVGKTMIVKKPVTIDAGYWRVQVSINTPPIPTAAASANVYCTRNKVWFTNSNDGVILLMTPDMAAFTAGPC